MIRRYETFVQFTKTLIVNDYFKKKAAPRGAPPSNQTIGFSLAAPLLDHLVLQVHF